MRPLLLALLLLLFVSAPVGAGQVESRTITLLNGDKITGQLVAEDNGTITLRHPFLGLLIIPKAKVAPNHVEGQVPPTQKKLPGIMGTRILQGWKRHLSAGIKGEEGNTVTSDLTMGLRLSKEEELVRQYLDGAWYYETTDRAMDKNKGYANYVLDCLIADSNWFIFGSARYEYDALKWWRHRLSIYTGPGYELYHSKTLRLRGRVGLGMDRTWGDDNRFTLEGISGAEAAWRLDERQSISSQFMAYFHLDDPSWYRTWLQAKWEIDLGLFKGTALETGFEHEYESHIDERSGHESHYDLIYFWRLGMDF